MDLKQLFAAIFYNYFATILTLHLQIRYQHLIEVNEAASIYSLIPVFACVFSYLINKEEITINTILGGSIITLTVVISNRNKRQT